MTNALVRPDLLILFVFPFFKFPFLYFQLGY